MKAAYFNEIKAFIELRRKINSWTLGEFAIFDNLPTPPYNHYPKLITLTPEQLEEWKFAGLTNWAILEMIYEQEVEKL